MVPWRSDGSVRKSCCRCPLLVCLLLVLVQLLCVCVCVCGNCCSSLCVLAWPLFSSNQSAGTWAPAPPACLTLFLCVLDL